MNPTIHSKISMKKFGGKIEDYFHIHSFMDSSKEVEPTNIHRILTHHLWFVKNVIVPIYGGTYKNSDDKDVDVKDLAELDHILQDFQGKFVPSLSDYFDLLPDNLVDEKRIGECMYLFKKHILDPSNSKDDIEKIDVLMVSPYANTGTMKSLYLTHNSWFIYNIIPRVFKSITLNVVSSDKLIRPSEFLNNLQYDSWIQNGSTYPKSFKKILDFRQPTSLYDRRPSHAVYDGIRSKPKIQ